jgi:hypothetical protein
MRAVAPRETGLAPPVHRWPIKAESSDSSFLETSKVNLFKAELAPHAQLLTRALALHPVERRSYLSAGSARHSGCPPEMIFRFLDGIADRYHFVTIELKGRDLTISDFKTIFAYLITHLIY